jgi:hypothetical protein
VAGQIPAIPTFHISGYEVQVNIHTSLLRIILLRIYASLQASVNCEGQSISGVEIILLSKTAIDGINCQAPSAQALQHLADDQSFVCLMSNL